jgi:membrane protein
LVDTNGTPPQLDGSEDVDRDRDDSRTLAAKRQPPADRRADTNAALSIRRSNSTGRGEYDPSRHREPSQLEALGPTRGVVLAFGPAGRYLTVMAIPERSEEDADGRRRSPGRERSRSHRRKPRRFGDLPDGAWARITRRSWDRFGANGGTNLAGALTYRSVLSLFPALLVLAALLGVLGQYPQTYDAVLAVARRVVPASVVESISGPLQGVITNKGGAAALFGVGLAVTIWAASGYIGAFSWAMNIVWEAERGRSWYRQWPFNVAVTLLLLVFAGAVRIGLVLSGRLGSSVGRQLGVGPSAISAWQVARWPVMAAIVINLVAALYYLTPNVRPPSLR